MFMMDTNNLSELVIYDFDEGKFWALRNNDLTLLPTPESYNSLNSLFMQSQYHASGLGYLLNSASAFSLPVSPQFWELVNSVLSKDRVLDLDLPRSSSKCNT